MLVEGVATKVAVLLSKNYGSNFIQKMRGKWLDKPMGRLKRFHVLKLGHKPISILWNCMGPFRSQRTHLVRSSHEAALVRLCHPP
jgi:hypothetical protein